MLNLDFIFICIVCFWRNCIFSSYISIFWALFNGNYLKNSFLCLYPFYIWFLYRTHCYFFAIPHLIWPSINIQHGLMERNKNRWKNYFIEVLLNFIKKNICFRQICINNIFNEFITHKHKFYENIKLVRMLIMKRKAKWSNDECSKKRVDSMGKNLVNFNPFYIININI